MSFVEEHLALVQKLEAEIARLKEAINQDAQYIYDLQKSQEARNTEGLDSYPIVESLFSVSTETHDHIIEYASKEPQYHHSWVRVVENAIIIGNEKKAIRIARTILPRFINNYANRSNSIWYTIIDKCSIDTIKEFVNMGIDISATGPNGWNALHYAMVKNFSMKEQRMMPQSSTWCAQDQTTKKYSYILKTFSIFKFCTQ